MTPIYINNFVGAVKLIDPRLLENNMATEAVNCELEAGIISPLKAPSLTQTLDAATGSVYFYNGTPYQFAGDCDIVGSPVQNSAGRLYFTDGNKPKKTNTTLHPVARALGIQVPVDPITASGDHLIGSTVIATVAYYYTYVTSWGEESAPSPASAVFEIYDEMSVDLSNFSVPAFSDQEITHKRIYRLAVGTAGAQFQFLAEIPAADTTYTDTTLNANLGDVCPTETWAAPPDDLRGLIYIGNGFMAGFRGNEVYVSEPYIPYAWPLSSMFSVPGQVVGLGHFGQTTVVCTDGAPVMLNGIDPRSMSQYVYPESYPCLSKKSIVSMLDCVIYASSRGLVICSAQGVNLLTGAIWSEGDWKALQPDTIIGCVHKGRYYGFFSGSSRGFVIDFRAFLGGAKYPTLIEIDLGASIIGGIINASVDVKNDLLYLIAQDGTSKRLYRYGASVSELTYTWASKTFFNHSIDNYGACMLNANGPVTFSYDDGQVAATNVSAPSVIRLPSGHKAYERSFEVSGTGDVYSVHIAETIRHFDSRGK